MLDTLLSILVILAVLVVIAIPVFIYAWIRTIPETRRIRRFAEFAATRTKISDMEFCQRAKLSDQDLPLIRKLREGLGREIKVDSEFIYPEDELCSYGFQYDDSVSGFIHGCGLIEKDPYWFPMEQGSTIRDIFPWIHQINSEQDAPSNGG
jgi:hypothetical protein